MKATIESTTKLLVINGLHFRVWEGVSEKGIRFVALVNRLETADPEVRQAFIQETVGPQKDPHPTTAGALERLGIATGVPEGYGDKPATAPVTLPPTSTTA